MDSRNATPYIVLDIDRAVRLARRFPDARVQVYADGWRAVDDARAMIEAHGLDDRVVVRHRDAFRAIAKGGPPVSCGVRAA